MCWKERPSDGVVHMSTDGSIKMKLIRYWHLDALSLPLYDAVGHEARLTVYSVASKPSLNREEIDDRVVLRTSTAEIFNLDVLSMPQGHTRVMCDHGKHSITGMNQSHNLGIFIAPAKAHSCHLARVYKAHSFSSVPSSLFPSLNRPSPVHAGLMWLSSRLPATTRSSRANAARSPRGLPPELGLNIPI